MQRKVILTVVLFIFGITCTATAGGDAGYKNGFYIKTHDGKFKLKLNAYSQFAWSYYTPDEGEDTSEFNIRRLRPSFSGMIWHPDLKFKFEWDLSKDAVLTDAYFDYVSYQYASIKAGQYYVPFNREQLTEPWRLQFIDRSIANDYFSLGRDLGVTLHKQFADGRFEYAFGVFNGNGANTCANDNNKYLYALRLGVYPNGYMNYSQSSMEDPDEVMFGVGAGINFNTMTMMDMEDEEEFGYDTDNVSITGDMVLKYRGFSFETAYYFANADPDMEDMQDVDSQAFVVQSGYMFVPETFEIAVRYAFVTPDKDCDDHKFSEITAGWNYFFRMHNVKMQMDYSYLVTEFPDSDDIKDNRVRMQFQYRF
jgi:hypothetical protein